MRSSTPPPMTSLPDLAIPPYPYSNRDSPLRCFLYPAVMCSVGSSILDSNSARAAEPHTRQAPPEVIPPPRRCGSWTGRDRSGRPGPRRLGSYCVTLGTIRSAAIPPSRDVPSDNVPFEGLIQRRRQRAPGVVRCLGSKGHRRPTVHPRERYDAHFCPPTARRRLVRNNCPATFVI